MFINNHSYRK